MAPHSFARENVLGFVLLLCAAVPQVFSLKVSILARYCTLQDLHRHGANYMTVMHPSQVFVLAGQSNMEGQAEVAKTFPNGTLVNGTLQYQLKDPRTAAEFAECWYGLA